MVLSVRLYKNLATITTLCIVDKHLRHKFLHCKHLIILVFTTGGFVRKNVYSTEVTLIFPHHIAPFEQLFKFAK